MSQNVSYVMIPIIYRSASNSEQCLLNNECHLHYLTMYAFDAFLQDILLEIVAPPTYVLCRIVESLT